MKLTHCLAQADTRLHVLTDDTLQRSLRRMRFCFVVGLLLKWEHHFVCTCRPII